MSKETPEKARIRAKEWYKANKVRKLAYDLAYNSKNRNKVNTQSKIWTHKNKEKRKIISKSYYEANKLFIFANCAARRARILRAMPKWLTEEQKQEIKTIYGFRPEGFHVDHIVPLKGKNVSGLHVPWNLQYLLASDNLQKGNKCV